jgi:hypothetical protein
MQRAGRYLNGNWGAPFIAAFIFLLLGSAAELCLGSLSSANELATYGFYSLIAGVVLQMGAYLKHGEVPIQTEVQQPSKPFKLSGKQKVLAIAAVAILVGASGIGYYFYNLPKVIVTPVVVTSTAMTISNGSTISITRTSTTSITNTVNPHQNYTRLTAEVGRVDSTKLSGGSVLIDFSVSAQGGAAPYNFVINWGDGKVENNTLGAFHRIFQGQTIPASAQVTVISADGQTVSLKVKIH